MNLGQNSPPHIIEKILIERDLGIIIANDLKWVHQIEKAVQTAVYVSPIRPHLEYAVPVWSPRFA